jgi:hypothetical protein
LACLVASLTSHATATAEWLTDAPAP